MGNNTRPDKRHKWEHICPFLASFFGGKKHKILKKKKGLVYGPGPIRHVEAHTIDLFFPKVFEANDSYSINNGDRKYVVKRMQRTLHPGTAGIYIGYTTQHDQKSFDRVCNTKRRLAVEYIPCLAILSINGCYETEHMSGEYQTRKKKHKLEHIYLPFFS